MKAHTRVGPGAIGIIVLFNMSFIVIAQLPATRVVKRTRRARSFAAASALWPIALLGVLPATLIHSELGATALLAGVATVFAIGECVHAVVLGPLVADLAPPHLKRLIDAGMRTWYGRRINDTTLAELVADLCSVIRSHARIDARTY